LPAEIRRSMLQTGMRVRIEERQHHGDSEFFEGTIKEILTKADTHPHGIKVKLDNGKTGRVVDILDGFTAQGKALVKVVGESVQVEEEKLPTEESQKTEFKSTFKFDLNRFEKGDGKKVQDKEIEKEISIAVSSMANSDGGQIFIGIRDNGEVIGLEMDYELFDNPNDDKFQRIVWQSIQKYLNNMTFISKIHLSLLNVQSKKICKIIVPRSDEPIFVHDNNTQESYVRIGPKSEKFPPAEFMKYCKKRFP
jgi:uncharacterized repeat protein (TIGR03833 family)